MRIVEITHNNHKGDNTMSNSLAEMKEFVNLSSYGKRGERWDYHKAIADEVAKLYEVYGDCERDKRKAKRIRDCAGYLNFGWYSNPDTGKNEIHLIELHCCKTRSCVLCQWRRSLLYKVRFSMNIIDILEQYPTAKFLFLTLTVKNCDLSDIRSTLSQMSTAFNRMTKSDAFTDVIGYIRNMEITRGENDSVHPHYHVLLMVNQSYFKSGHYISKDGWAKYWRKYMKLDYDPVCDIRLVRDKTKRLDVVKELFKYTIKETDIKTDNWYKILMDSLHHVRAISSGGALKNIIKDDTNLQDHDLLHLTESGSEMQPLNKTVAYQWNRPIKRYRKV